MGEAGLEPAPENAVKSSVSHHDRVNGGAESGAAADCSTFQALPRAVALMVREFMDARPAERVRLARVWAIARGGPAARALGVPLTDADKTDGTA